MSDSLPKCPHCGQTMSQWQSTPELSWESDFQFVCFNDECPYYARGWEWMESQYHVHASYRHRLDPNSGKSGPLPVWSPQALKDRIIPDRDRKE